MIRRILFVALVGSLVTMGSAFAQFGLGALTGAVTGFMPTHSAVGCGIGTRIFSGSAGKLSMLLASTTNNLTYLQQSVSISSGTSGCGDVGPMDQVDPRPMIGGGALGAVEKRQEKFIASNFENLSNQMSQGEGDFLSSYGQMLGCQEAAMPYFKKVTQENYNGIFTATRTPAEVLVATKQVVKNDTRLAAACSAL